jgi:hypothetical protein
MTMGNTTAAKVVLVLAILNLIFLFSELALNVFGVALS